MEAGSVPWRSVRTVSADASVQPLPVQVFAHALEAHPASDACNRGAVTRLQLARPSEFVADLERLSFAVVRCPEGLASSISRVLHLAPCPLEA